MTFVVRTIISALAFLVFFLCDAQAQINTCIMNWAEEQIDGSGALALDDSEAQELIYAIARQYGIATSITAFPCASVDKVQAVAKDASNPRVPRGEYVIYDPNWVREVFGDDTVQATFAFAHEIGHFVNRHFGSRSHLSIKEKETEADGFAGCAVARIEGKNSWSSLENLVTRLRETSHPTYPNRQESLAVVRAGYIECGGVINVVDENTLRLSEVQSQLIAMGFDVNREDGIWDADSAISLKALARLRAFDSDGSAPNPSITAKVRDALRSGFTNRKCTIETRVIRERIPETCEDVNERSTEEFSEPIGFSTTCTVNPYQFCNAYGFCNYQAAATFCQSDQAGAYREATMRCPGAVAVRNINSMCQCSPRGCFCNVTANCIGQRTVREVRTECTPGRPAETMDREVCTCLAEESCPL